MYCIVFTPTYREFGHISPKMTSPIVLPPKNTSLRGNTSFEPWSVKIGPAVPVHRIEEKSTRQDRTGQSKSHKGVTPTQPIVPKFAWWLPPQRNHVRKVCDHFTGVEFWVFLLILAWALQQLVPATEGVYSTFLCQKHTICHFVQNNVLYKKPPVSSVTILGFGRYASIKITILRAITCFHRGN